ncbi:MAG: OB-fold nucleic acid binding domain-containing protein [Candidatus Jordarchaeales archaeon]
MSLEEKVRFVVEKAGVSRTELQNLIERKKRAMGDLISDEGALHLVARDLGVDLSEIDEYKPVKIYVRDLKPDMRNVTITGRVKRIHPVRVFEKRGVQGKVASIVISDITGDIRVVLWGDHVSLVEKGAIKEGMIVRVVKGYIREGLRGELEVHLGKGGFLDIEPGDVDEREYPLTEKRLFRLGDLLPEMWDVDVEAVVQRVYPTTVFSRELGEGKRKSIILSDETGSVRAVFWDENADVVDTVKEGDILRIEGGYTKLGLQGDVEIHAGRLARVTIIPGKESEKGKLAKINDLEPGMLAVDVEGKVVELPSTKEFTRIDGSVGVMSSLVIADDTGKVRVVAWGEQAEIVANAEIGDTLKIKGGYTKIGLEGKVEVHIGRFSKVELIPLEEPLEQAPPKKLPSRKFLSQLEDGEFVEVRGTIIRLMRKRIVYEICPICSKRLVSERLCSTCKTVEPKLLLAAHVLIDDGTSVVKAIFFGKEAEKLLGVTAKEAYEFMRKEGDISPLLKTRASFLEGKELVLTAKAIFNPSTGKTTLIVYSFKEASPEDEAEKLIEYLESRI